MILDKELKQKVIDRDRRAQLELYRVCFNLLMGIARRYKNNEEDKQTLVNNAFIKIVSHLDRYEEQSNFHAWVKRIVMNEVIDDYRKNIKYKNIIDQDYPVENIHIESYAQVDYRYSEQELLNMMKKLPNATRVVFNLFAVDGFSHKEICEQLGIGLETSKWHMKEARKILRALFNNRN